MAIVIYKNVSINGIKDIVLTVGVVSSIILCMKAKTDKLVVNLLFCGQPSFCNKWLYQDSADMPVSVFCKANHTIWTSIKIFVMRFDAFEKGCKIIVGISEIVQFDDFRTIRR